nr:hypothetical protein [Streptomyces caeruleatus]
MRHQVSRRPRRDRPDTNCKTPGRKRALAVDVLGLIIGGVVLAASAHGNAAGTAPLTASKTESSSTAHQTHRGRCVFTREATATVR